MKDSRIESRCRRDAARALACAAAMIAGDLARAGAIPAEVVRGNTALAVDLYRQLCAETGNLFFSPASISTALAMTYAGARGRTAEEMARALHWTAEGDALHEGFAAIEARNAEIQKSGAVRLLTANSLWPHREHALLDTYLSLLRRHYGVSVTPLDYVREPEPARATINRWVEERTQQRIRNLIASPLSPTTRLVLVNAIYFKGNWARQFAAAATTMEPFEVAPGKTVAVPFMTHAAPETRKPPEFSYTEDDGVQVLELPYAGEDLAMLIVLPKARGGLSTVENALSLDQLDRWAQGLSLHPVRVFLPKFRITWGTRELAPMLQALGMKEAFAPGRADFSGMDGRRPGEAEDSLFISQVLHKAFVEVNEEGTEAAAATAVVMRVTAVAQPRPPVVFRADHPFLFVIRDRKTGSVLFMGRVADPSASTE